MVTEITEEEMFIGIMRNDFYWDNVIIDKGVEFDSKTATISEEDSTENLDYQIIQDSLKAHSTKRYNRKYINSRKYLIKDKKHMYWKAFPSTMDKYRDIETKLEKDKILSVDNLQIVSTEDIYKTSEYTVVEAYIEYISVTNYIFNKYESYEKVDSRGFFIPSKYDTHMTFVFLNEYEDNYLFSDRERRKRVSIRKDLIKVMSVKELNHIPKIKFEQRVSSKFKYLLNTDSLKTHFYGKLVYNNPQKGFSFCNNIMLSFSDKKYYHERETPTFKIERDLDKIDFSYENIYMDSIIQDENFDFMQSQEYIYTDKDILNYCGYDFNIPEYTEEEKFSVCSKIDRTQDILDQMDFYISEENAFLPDHDYYDDFDWDLNDWDDFECD